MSDYPRVHVSIGNVLIPLKHARVCLHAINALNDPYVKNRNVGKNRWYRHLGPEPEQAFDNLKDALAYWRYDADLKEDYLVGDEETGFVVEIKKFTGREWGDDEVLFHAIAPYVTACSEIAVRSETGEIWGYRFRDGVVFKLTCDISWVENFRLTDATIEQRV